MKQLAWIAVALTACHAAPRGGEMQREGTVQSEGGDLFYRQVGSGDPIVMVHGGPGMDSGYLQGDFGPLAAHHTLVFYDQRGAGRSSLRGDDPALFTMAHHVADLEALRVHLGLARMTLLAHSFGPAIAASYAIAHPDRVARMIFLGPVSPRGGDLWKRYGGAVDERLTPEERTELARLERALQDEPDVVANCRAYWAIGLKPRVAHPDLVAKITGDFCSAPPEAIRHGLFVVAPATVASLGDWDFRAALAAVKAPTLILHGDADTIPMDMVEEWTTALPNATLIKLPDTGHFPYVERPELTWPPIDAFLAKTPAT